MILTDPSYRFHKCLSIRRSNALSFRYRLQSNTPGPRAVSFLFLEGTWPSTTGSEVFTPSHYPCFRYQNGCKERRKEGREKMPFFCQLHFNFSSDPPFRPLSCCNWQQSTFNTIWPPRGFSRLLFLKAVFALSHQMHIELTWCPLSPSYSWLPILMPCQTWPTLSTFPPDWISRKLSLPKQVSGRLSPALFNRSPRRQKPFFFRKFPVTIDFFLRAEMFALWRQTS